MSKNTKKSTKKQIIIDLEDEHFTLKCSEEMYTDEILALADRVLVMLSVLEYLSSLEGNSISPGSDMLQ